MTVRVVYRKGMFVPQDDLDLQDGAEGVVLVASSPTTSDAAEQKRLLAGLVSDMKENPIPAGSPRLTRDQMHERS